MLNIAFIYSCACLVHVANLRRKDEKISLFIYETIASIKFLFVLFYELFLHENYVKTQLKR